MVKIKWKKTLIILIGSLVTLYFVGGFILTWSIYKDNFGRRFDTDLNLNFNLNQNDFPDLRFEEGTFFTDSDNELKSWLYHKNGSTIESSDFKALIVLSHGMGDGHNSYLPDVNALVEADYLVFAFDNTGTGKSEGGEVKGFPQSIIDLGSALDYIENDSNLNKLPLALYGHSWGGYSVMNILHKDYPIKAMIERSGPISSKSIFMSEAYKEIGKAAILFEPFVSLTEYIKFGKVATYNALDGINSVDIPILLMHSKYDTMIPIEISPLIEESAITNSKVELKIFEDGGHDFLMSDKASEYQKEVLKERNKLREEYENIPVKEKRKFIDTIDLKKLNEINSEIMDEMISFFDNIFGI